MSKIYEVAQNYEMKVYGYHIREFQADSKEEALQMASQLMDEEGTADWHMIDDDSEVISEGELYIF